MKRVITAAVLVPIVLLVVLIAPIWLLTLVVAAVAAVATHEYLELSAKYGNPPFRVLVFVTLVAIFTPFVIADTQWALRAESLAAAIVIVVVAMPFLMLAAGMSRPDLRSALPSAAVSMVPVPLIFLPLSALLGIRSLPSGWFFLVLLFFIVWSGDIFAYYVGKSFGRRKLAPRISPNKTWEGAIASVLGSVVVALLLCAAAPWLQATLVGYGVIAEKHYLESPAWWMVVMIAVAINVAAQLGDLVESAIKRGAGVKDSGSILPGHGGMLDRIDALLFAAPVGVVLFAITLQQFIHLD